MKFLIKQMSYSQNKNSIRKNILKNRSELSSFERTEKSQIIQNKVIQYIREKKWNKMLSYMHVYSEVETGLINRFALGNDFELAVPRVINAKEMEFYIIKNIDDDVKKGVFGIDEPMEGLPIVRYNDVKMALIPGVVFDLNGNRIGYGKGYYDYFLAKYPWIYKIGLAFECQIMPNLQAEKHDQKIDLLVTEKNIYSFLKKP